jgi:thiamine transporter ThiT
MANGLYAAAELSSPRGMTPIFWGFVLNGLMCAGVAILLYVVLTILKLKVE